MNMMKVRGHCSKYIGVDYDRITVVCGRVHAADQTQEEHFPLTSSAVVVSTLVLFVTELPN